MPFDVTDLLVTSVPSVSLLCVVIYLLKNPEKAEKWGSILARVISSYSNAAEKRSVSGDIQADIKSFARNVGSKIDPMILPYGIKIEWEKTETTSPESFVRDGNVTVRMRHHSDQARNFALATLAYVQNGLLPDTRPHFDEDVSDALNLTTVRKILLERKRTDALSIFNKEIVLTKSEELMVAHICKFLQNLDALGLFDQVLLRELADLGKRLTNIAPTDDSRGEIRDFVMFFEKLTEKKPGIDVSPTFFKNLLRVSIVMIAKSAKYAELGVEPHLKWVDNCLKEEVDSIYICARGFNMKAARELDTLLGTYSSLRRIGEHTGKVLGKQGGLVDAICIGYRRVRER